MVSWTARNPPGGSSWAGRRKSAAAETPGGKDAAARDARDPGGELRGSPVQIKPINPLIEKLVK